MIIISKEVVKGKFLQPNIIGRINLGGLQLKGMSVKKLMMKQKNLGVMNLSISVH